MHARCSRVTCRPRRGVAATHAFIAGLLLMVPSAITLAAEDEKTESPTEAVRMVLTDVFQILEDSTLKNPSRQAERRHLLLDALNRLYRRDPAAIAAPELGRTR